MTADSKPQNAPYFRIDVVHEGDTEKVAYHVTELRLWGKFRLETDGGELVIKPVEDDDD